MTRTAHDHDDPCRTLHLTQPDATIAIVASHLLTSPSGPVEVSVEAYQDGWLARPTGPVPGKRYLRGALGRTAHEALERLALAVNASGPDPHPKRD